jgi:Domain of unknown function (DUF4395)
LSTIRSSRPHPVLRAQVDPRASRFAAALTTLVLAGGLAAAFLNAAFGFCLGCEVYLLVRRVAARHATA